VTGQTSGAEVAACVSLAIGLFSASLVPFFLLVEAEHLTPRWLRESDIPERVLLLLVQACGRVRLVAVDALLGLLLLTAPMKGATS
jgi:hypothetical protein